MMEETGRVGSWMQTASGVRFYPLDPRPTEILIEDLAAALSRICRFGGHCREFYSVAQHSVLVSETCPPDDALWGLLHDAAEAYLGDLIRPLKRQPFAYQWREVEAQLQRAIYHRFGLVGEPPAAIRDADETLLATEARDLMGNETLQTWCLPRGPLPAVIIPWGPRVSEVEFMARFHALTGEAVPA